MKDWKEAKWTFVKSPRNRYIGVEIDGVFCLVDLMPYSTGFLSFPKIHGWQRLPLYYPKTPEAEAEMRKVKISEEKLGNIDKKVAGTGAFFFVLVFVLTGILYPVFVPLLGMLSIPGILGLLTVVLGFCPMYFLFSFLFGQPLREEMKTYQRSSTKISIRYKQDRSTKFMLYFSLLMPLFSVIFVYRGSAPGLFLGLFLALYPPIMHVIPNNADVQYLLRQNPRKIKQE